MFKKTFKTAACILAIISLIFGAVFFTFLMLQNKLDYAWVFVRSLGPFFVLLTIITIVFFVLYKKACNPNSKIGKMEQEQLKRLKYSVRSLELHIESLAKQTNSEEYYNLPSKAEIDDVTELGKIYREYNMIIQDLNLKLLEKNVSLADAPQDITGWCCLQCGTINSLDSNFCKKCGMHRP